MLYFLRIHFKLSHFSRDTMHFGCAEGTQPTGGAAKQTDSKLHLFFFFSFALFSVVLIFTDQAKKKRVELNSVNEVTSEKFLL